VLPFAPTGMIAGWWHTTTMTDASQEREIVHTFD
jgi:hypothetical protein